MASGKLLLVDRVPKRAVALRADGAFPSPLPEWIRHFPLSAMCAMETAPDCYAMAEQCEQQAATVKSDQPREILLEVAAKWRGQPQGNRRGSASVTGGFGTDRP
jgi:hypothetical protein